MTAVPPGPDFDFSGHTVLVIDDHDDSLFLLVEMLRHCGAEVFGARDTEEARQVIRERAPTVILTDITCRARPGSSLPSGCDVRHRSPSGDADAARRRRRATDRRLADSAAILGLENPSRAGGGMSARPPGERSGGAGEREKRVSHCRSPQTGRPAARAVRQSSPSCSQTPHRCALACRQSDNRRRHPRLDSNREAVAFRISRRLDTAPSASLIHSKCTRGASG
jgi:hypothetical protein